MQLSISASPFIPCQWRLTRKLLGGILLVSAGQVISALSTQPDLPLTTPPEITSRAATKSIEWEYRTGPWGTLRLREINLKAPVAALARLQFTETRMWSFGSMSWPEIQTFLLEANLSESQLAELFLPDRRLIGKDTLINGIELSSDLLLSLSPESRLYIYNLLAQFPENSDHALPFVLPDQAGDEQLDLNPALREALIKLSYYRSGIRCLTDAKLLVPFVTDADELIRLKRFLVHSPSYTIEITRESLLQRQEVARYWSRNHGKSAHNLLRILADSPDLAGLDLVHFLPPLPQGILNRFPDQDLPPSINCFWTAFNFFSRNPDHQFLPLYDVVDQAAHRALKTLETRFVLTEAPYEFGDVIAFFTRQGDGRNPPELLHTASFIVDDIVMTKNGAGDFKPIALMPLDHVVSLYAWPGGIEVRGYRQRP